MVCLVLLGMLSVGCGQNHDKERLAGSRRSIDLASATNEINLGTNDVIVEAAGAQVDLSGRRVVEKFQAAIELDPALSGAAERIVIRAAGGKIVLRGSVAGEKEKAAIAAKASAIVGPENLENRIEVEGANSRPEKP